MNSLRQDLAEVLNRHSRESGSNSPDWILAEYLILSMDAFDKATQSRDKWYGVHLRPGHCEWVEPKDEMAEDPALPTFGGNPQ